MWRYFRFPLFYSAIAVLLLVVSNVVYFLASKEYLRRGFALPSIDCPDSSRDYQSHRRVGLIRQLGNWSFEEPAGLAELCRNRPSATDNNSNRSMLHRRMILAIVPLTISMIQERQDLRQTWGADLNGKFGQLLFLVQLSSGQIPPSSLVRENKLHRDILIAYHSGPDSVDSYGFLVRKVLAGLGWFTRSCSRGFDFVLKADHDSYWHVASLASQLRHCQATDPLAFGAVQRCAPVSRSSASKFFISKEEYQNDQFPAYVSGGPGYALSKSAVAAVVNAASLQMSTTGALWLEDVYITGILPALAFPQEDANLQIKLFQHLHSDYVFICRYYSMLDSTVQWRPPLAMHGVQGSQLRALHSWLQRQGIAETAMRLHRFV